MRSWAQKALLSQPDTQRSADRPFEKFDPYECLRRDVVKELRAQSECIIGVMNGCMAELTTALNRVVSPATQGSISQEVDEQCQKMARRLTRRIKRKLDESLSTRSNLDVILGQLLRRRRHQAYRRTIKKRSMTRRQAPLSFAVIRKRLMK